MSKYSKRSPFSESEIVNHADGSKEYFRDGKLHRDDGPAVERANGTKLWYRNGELHREDGPAIEHANGKKYWYRNGVFIPM